MTTRKSLCHENGFMLVEAMVAVLLLSIAMLGLVSLQSNLIKSSSDNLIRAEAITVAQTIISDMTSYDQKNLANYISERPSDVPSLPEGKVTVELLPRNLAHVTVTWKQPGMDAHRVELFEVISDVYSN